MCNTCNQNISSFAGNTTNEQLLKEKANALALDMELSKKIKNYATVINNLNNKNRQLFVSKAQKQANDRQKLIAQQEAQKLMLLQQTAKNNLLIINQQIANNSQKGLINNNPKSFSINQLQKDRVERERMLMLQMQMADAQKYQSLNANIGIQPAPKPLYLGADGDDDNADLEEDLGVDLADKKTTAQKVGGWIESLGPLADIYNKVMGKGPIDMGTRSSSSNEEEVQTDNSWIYWTIGGVVAISLAIWAFVKFGNN